MLGIMVTGTADAAAADVAVRPFIWEAGIRYWVSTGSSAKDLDLPPEVGNGARISRLDYWRRHAATPEVFGRVDHPSGVFVKAKAGIGNLDAGELVNQDFPPIVLGYSRTSHALHDGVLGYWTADLGYTFLERRAPSLDGRYRLGLFAGYHGNREQMSADGCRQTVAGQPDFICVPSIGNERIVISQSNVWDGLRLGLAGDLDLGTGTTLTAEASWLRLSLNGHDTHHLRAPPNCAGGSCFTSPQRETGEGKGMEIEVALKHHLTPNVSLGAGARYWRYWPTQRAAHLRFQDGAARTLPLPWRASGSASSSRQASSSTEAKFGMPPPVRSDHHRPVERHRPDGSARQPARHVASGFRGRAAQGACTVISRLNSRIRS